MNLRQCVICAAAAALATFVAPAAAAGQSPPGSTRIAGLIGGSLGAGNAAPTLGITMSRAVAPRLAIEGDLSHFSDLKLFENQLAPFTTSHARTTLLSGNLVVILPAGMPRLRPYVAAGGGVARVRREVSNLPFCDSCEPTNYTKPVLSLGGGLDVQVWRALAVGLDVRFQRVFEDEGLYRPNLRNLSRIGSVVSYRF